MGKESSDYNGRKNITIAISKNDKKLIDNLKKKLNKKNITQVFAHLLEFHNVNQPILEKIEKEKGDIATKVERLENQVGYLQEERQVIFGAFVTHDAFQSLNFENQTKYKNFNEKLENIDTKLNLIDEFDNNFHNIQNHIQSIDKHINDLSSRINRLETDLLRVNAKLKSLPLDQSISINELDDIKSLLLKFNKDYKDIKINVRDRENAFDEIKELKSKIKIMEDNEKTFGL